MSKIKLLTSYAIDEYCLRFAVVLLLVAIVTALTTSCGYRLSGTNTETQLFSPLLKNISIEGVPKYDTFRIQLKSDLLGYRMNIVEPQSATVNIVIKNNQVRQHAITIGDDAKAREYLLMAQVDFQVVTNTNKSKRQYALQSVRSETTYAYYPQNLSISSNEKRRALTFLNQDLSSKLIARLRSFTKNDR